MKIKDILRENLGWFIIGAIFIIVGLLFLIVALPQIYEGISSSLNLSRQNKNLRRKIPKISSEKYINKIRSTKKLYEQRANNMNDMYRKLSGSLEKWFSKFGDKTPPYSRFKTEFEDMQKMLEEQLYEAKISIGTKVNQWDKSRFGEEEETEFELFLPGMGLTWEKLPTDWTEVWKTREEMLSAIKLVQKRYWIREYIIRLILDNNLRVERIDEFVFFQKIEGIEEEKRFGMRTPPIVYPSKDSEYDIESKTHEVRVRKMMKEALSDKIRIWENTINFGVALTIHSNDVTKFLKLLLETPQNRKKWQPLDPNLPEYLPIRISGFRVYNLKTYETRLERIIKMDSVRGKDITLKLKEEEEGGIEAQRVLDKREEGEEDKIKEEIKDMFKKKVLKTPYPVMLLLTGSVIDFDEKYLLDDYRWPE